MLAADVRVHGTYSFTDARYVTYTVVSGTRTTSYATNRVPGVAPSIASLSLDVGDPNSRFVSVEERYRSNILVNDANTASAPASIITNLRGSMRVGPTSLFGGIGNLFDAVYDTSVSINAFGGRYFDPAAGRTFYVGIDLLSVKK